MKVSPMNAPAPSPASPASDSRARAINILTQAPQAQEHPVQHPSKVSPEEMTAVQAPTSKPEAEEVEATPEAKAPVKDPAIEQQFQDLARQERILRAKAQKQQQELQTQKAALEAQKAALDAREKQYDPSNYVERSRIKQDILGVMAETGLSYDDVTQQLINQQPKDPRVEAEMKALRDELKALRDEAQQGKAQSQKQQDESYQNAVKQIERDTLKLIKAEPEAYEAIAKTNSHKDVVELIEETWKKDGILMTVEEAAQEVENYLVEESYNTVTRIDKIKKRLAEANASTAQPKPVVKEATEANKEQQQPTMKTLTNATASTRKLSARERALLAFKNELKA